jgi:hypothetical protein
VVQQGYDDICYYVIGSGLATLLIALLTADEERIDARTAELRFDIDLLAERLARLYQDGLIDDAAYAR